MTIPATNNKLLVSENWQKIYQSFRNADFQSYDFDTIRRILIAYIQENYPEDFNDFIDSSEYVALIDLISYLGQNLSFRIDLNARENFLETAQRRDSILKLAQLVGYVPKRNVPSSGLLKIMSVATTDNVIDSTGVNLANTTVSWNDTTNTSWYEQFIAIMNSSFVGTSSFGSPDDQDTINGVVTQQYKVNSVNTDLPIFGFTSNVNGVVMSFEVVPASFKGKTYIYESAPAPRSPVSLLYQNDNQGSSSSGTGFFAMFKQGSMGLSSFNISNPVPNEIIGVNVSGINNTDVWLWQLDPTGAYPSDTWSKVPSVVGNNVIYNSLSSKIRNVYSVSSREGDQIDLNFADGSFGDLPKGDFVLYYRQSNGLTYSIKPEQMTGVVIRVPYKNSVGQDHILTLTMSLQYTVNNSSAPETNTVIQQNAPQTYYTQNRMVTGEDYNISPLTLNSNILKVKSINRVSSGVSKYFELSDVSGKYSSTNIFADDGILYKNTQEQNFRFSFSSRNNIFSAIKNLLEPVVASNALKSFYLDNYRTSSTAKILNTNLNNPQYTWNLSNKVSGQSRGYFFSLKNGTVEVPQSVGSVVSDMLTYVAPGAMIKFVPPLSAAGQQQYFLPNGKVVSTPSSKTTEYIWSTVIQVIGDGSNLGLGNLNDGTGPVVLGNHVADNAIPVEIVPVFVNTFSYAFENDLVSLCLTQRNFGLRFDSDTRAWKVIEDSNLNLVTPFTLAYEGDTSNSQKDSSWLIAFTWDGDEYLVRYRLNNHVFQSVNQTGFFVDSSDVNFDYENNSVVKDKINVLSINTKPQSNAQLESDYTWQVDNSIIEADGYVDPAKVYVSFYSHQDSGILKQVTDPDSFVQVVGPVVTGVHSSGYVFFKLQTDGVSYRPVSADTFRIYQTQNDAINDGVDSDYLYYIIDLDVVKNSSMVLQPDYIAYRGRENLNFHYQHNSGEERRIDPAKSNIIDIYVLTSEYDTAFRNWLLNTSGPRPLSPTSQSLENNYSGNLEPIKTISDQIIYQPVSYKVLFGNTAPANLQAKFKAVQSPTSVSSKNDITSRILTAINNFFALENWDFGQSFYFSELSTYVMNLLSPDITNFVIVPTINNFGSLYEIACQKNEIFISGATAADVEVISALTASQLNTTAIVTSANT